VNQTTRSSRVKGAPEKQAQGQQQSANHVGDGRNDCENRGVADSLPEHPVVGEEIPEIRQANIDLESLRFDRVNAVPEGAQHRVDREAGIDQQRRSQQDRQRNRCGAARIDGRFCRCLARQRLNPSCGEKLHDRRTTASESARATPHRVMPAKAGIHDLPSCSKSNRGCRPSPA
jgi:hypothetical protein